MGRRMDWVPCFEYGDRISVPFGTQLDQPLMDPLQYGDDEVEGKIDVSAGRYFVHRIVGQVTFNWQTDVVQNREVFEQIWPGIIAEPTTGLVIAPGFIDTPTGVNPRLWFKRVKIVVAGIGGEFTDLSDTSSQWFFNIDIRPNQVIDDGQMPVYSIFNNDTSNSIDFRMYFRLLLTSLE